MDFDDKNYPEHARFLEISDDLQVVHNFLEWFMDKNKGVLVWNPSNFKLKEMEIEDLLGRYFEINFDEMEIEHEQMKKVGLA